MIDHLVYATPDLATTVEALTDRLGIAPTPGGTHPGRGTRNALVGLGDGAYLEIIGPDPEQPVPTNPRPFGVDALSTPALVSWSARPALPLEVVVEAARANGYDLGPIVAMSRHRPDGVLLEWRLSVPEPTASEGGVLPFVIDWDAAPHPSASLPPGVVLDELRLEHPEPERIAAVLAALGGAGAVIVPGARPRLSATLHTPAARPPRLRAEPAPFEPNSRHDVAVFVQTTSASAPRPPLPAFEPEFPPRCGGFLVQTNQRLSRESEGEGSAP